MLGDCNIDICNNILFLSCHLRYHVTDGCSIIDKATGKIEMVKQ